MSFAAKLLAAWTSKYPGSRPYASEAVAAVLLDRAGVMPDDIEQGRVLAVASDDDVHDAITSMVGRIWFGRAAEASGFKTEWFENGKSIVVADESDVYYSMDWQQAAGETGAGVIAVVRDADRVPPDLKSWMHKIVVLDDVDADGVIASVVQLVTGTRPTITSSLEDVSIADVRTALGPRDAAEAAVQQMVRSRDQRAHKAAQTADREKSKAEKSADTVKDFVESLRGDSPKSQNVVGSKHERDTPLSKLSGFGSARAWGLEVAADLLAFKQGELEWADIDRGVLLSGPPGVGKTRFARALAAEASVPFFPSSFSALCGGSSSGYNVEKGLKKLFDEARKASPCVVFLDEMDSVPGRDYKPDHNSSYFNAVNNAFLEVLDGATPRDGIVVIAASNFPDRIDPALKRPGRLDREIAIPMPSIEDLAGIIRHHLGTDTTGMDDQVRIAARACRGMSPADVEQICRDARRRARRDLGRMSALPGDIVWVLRERRGDADPRFDRMISVHESGHAVVALALGIEIDHVDADRVHTLVGTQVNPTAERIEADIAMTLAGRAAEKVILGEVTTGSVIDLRMATSLALAYHVKYGFGDVAGLLTIDVPVLDGWSPLHKAVQGLVDRCYARALAVVGRHRDNIERVAEALQRDRYLDKGEVRALMRPTLYALMQNRPDPQAGMTPLWAPTPPRPVGHGWGQRRAA